MRGSHLLNINKLRYFKKTTSEFDFNRPAVKGSRTVGSTLTFSMIGHAKFLEASVYFLKHRDIPSPM